jgi:hypothetical protein
MTDSVRVNSPLKESELMLALVLLEAHKFSDLNEYIANIEISDNHHNTLPKVALKSDIILNQLMMLWKKEFLTFLTY